MSWPVSCADCGVVLGIAYDSAPHQLYCLDCAAISDSSDTETDDIEVAPLEEVTL